jgi:hypothetical protein
MENYNHKNMQVPFKLKIRSMKMDEYERKFLEVLRYVGFIKDENVKIQIFVSILPSFYIENNYFDEPKTLEEATRKAKYIYEHNKGRIVSYNLIFLNFVTLLYQYGAYSCEILTLYL